MNDSKLSKLNPAIPGTASPVFLMVVNETPANIRRASRASRRTRGRTLFRFWIMRISPRPPPLGESLLCMRPRARRPGHLDARQHIVPIRARAVVALPAEELIDRSVLREEVIVAGLAEEDVGAGAAVKAVVG